jgi:hypothetical protein
MFKHFDQILTLGSRGVDVYSAQLFLMNQLLLKGPADSIFGLDTHDALIAWQRKVGLVPDGKLGPISWARMFQDNARAALVHSDNLGERVSAFHRVTIETALSLLNVREELGPNHGQMVDRIIKYSGGEVGQPWCQYFVNFCTGTAAGSLSLVDPLKPYSGHVLTNAQRACRAGWKVGKFDAVRGDVFWMEHGNGTGHTGLVLNYANGVLQTIEGNTNKAGSREGDGVYLKQRKYTEVAGVYRLPDPAK